MTNRERWALRHRLHHGRWPTPDELAAWWRVSVKTAAQVLEIYQARARQRAGLHLMGYREGRALCGDEDGIRTDSPVLVECPECLRFYRLDRAFDAPVTRATLAAFGFRA